jgi:hypothetical protein
MGKDLLEEKIGKHVFGMAEMRNRQAEVMDLVSNNNVPVYLRDNKRNACSRNALLISPEMCSVILDCYTFDIKINVSNNIHHLSLPQIGASGKGETIELAIDFLISDIIKITRAYFAEMDLHSRLPEMKQRYPWYLKIYQCKSPNDIRKAIGIETFLANCKVN